MFDDSVNVLFLSFAMQKKYVHTSARQGERLRVEKEYQMLSTQRE